MEKIQSLAFWQKPKFILVLILATFFLKGVFLATLYPVFGGQDEARHYNTIQYLNEPEDAVSENAKNVRANDISKRDKDNFDTYNFSEEIQKTATAANVDILRDDIYNTQVFSESFKGQNEEAINSGGWKPYNYYSNPDIASISLYHKIAVQIEKIFSEQSILVRFYLIRIFSVLLGTAAILLAYLIAKTIGFSAKHSLLLTAIIAFQPKFSMYFTNINYDALFILLFIIFTYAAVLTLKKGLNWKTLALLIASTLLGILAKPTGAVLLVAFAILMVFFGHEKIKTMSRNVKLFSFFVSLVAIALFSVFLVKYLPNGSYMPESVISSAGKYLSKTLSLNKFASPSETYWGVLGWTNSWIIGITIYIIWAIQFFAAIGIGIFLFSKKERPDFLPEKKYIVFLLSMIVLLQLGIRFADWSLFQALGRIETGLPGRYFLPNIAAHIILVFVGIGVLVEKIALRFKKSDLAEKYFETSMIAGLILMMSLSMYLVFNVIIFRYYL